MSKSWKKFWGKSTKISNEKDIDIKRFDSIFVYKKNNGILDKEFQEIEDYGKEKEAEEKEEERVGLDWKNRIKNRYKNIIPYNDSLVKLKTSNEYINASFVPGIKNTKLFIATQGPKEETIEDFWRMILDYEVKMIICLTKLTERGMSKCSKYWPEEGDDNFKPLKDKDIQVRLLSENEDKFRNKAREFHVQFKDKQLKITQYHFMNWPDHGVPEDGEKIRKFCEHLDKKDIQKSSNPIVIHDSAGVGRSCTTIAILNTMHRVREFSDNKSTENTTVNIFEEVKSLRERRPLAIQTRLQYEFIYTCIKDFIQNELTQ